MAKPIKLLKEAEIELCESVHFYETQVSGLGLDFEAEIRNALRIIRQNPEMWPLRKRGVRRYLMDRFPYAIHYPVEPNLIRFVAVAHCSRKPDYWKNR